MIDFSAVTTKVKSAANMESVGGSDTIEFLCREKDVDVIPEPIPANKVLPDWYRNLEGKLGPGTEQSTVKRCMPFLDALSMGWIIPLAAEVDMESEEFGKAKYKWGFRDDLISGHSPDQLGGDEHPAAGMPILKFHNYWAMRVPDGYSVLITAPLNRMEPRFQVFSGVVDADSYFNFVNFPFLWTQPGYHGVLEAGTPLVQVIPFKRDGIISDGTVGQMEVDDLKELSRTSDRLGAEESHYRNNLWQAKSGSRMVKRERE